MSTRKPTATPEQLSKGGSQRRLRSVKNVRCLVADVLREVESKNDVSDPLVARVLIHGAQVLAQIIRESDLEARIARLERGERPGSEQQEAH